MRDRRRGDGDHRSNLRLTVGAHPRSARGVRATQAPGVTTPTGLRRPARTPRVTGPPAVPPCRAVRQTARRRAGQARPRSHRAERSGKHRDPGCACTTPAPLGAFEPRRLLPSPHPPGSSTRRAPAPRGEDERDSPARGPAVPSGPVNSATPRVTGPPAVPPCRAVRQTARRRAGQARPRSHRAERSGQLGHEGHELGFEEGVEAVVAAFSAEAGLLEPAEGSGG